MPRNVALTVVCARETDAAPASRQRHKAMPGAKSVDTGDRDSRSDRTDNEVLISFVIRIYPPIFIDEGLTAIFDLMIFCSPVIWAGPHRPSSGRSYISTRVALSAMRSHNFVD